MRSLPSSWEWIGGVSKSQQAFLADAVGRTPGLALGPTFGPLGPVASGKSAFERLHSYLCEDSCPVNVLALSLLLYGLRLCSPLL